MKGMMSSDRLGALPSTRSRRRWTAISTTYLSAISLKSASNRESESKGDETFVAKGGWAELMAMIGASTFSNVGRGF